MLGLCLEEIGLLHAKRGTRAQTISGLLRSVYYRQER